MPRGLSSFPLAVRALAHLIADVAVGGFSHSAPITLVLGCALQIPLRIGVSTLPARSLLRIAVITPRPSSSRSFRYQAPAVPLIPPSKVLQS